MTLKLEEANSLGLFFFTCHQLRKHYGTLVSKIMFKLALHSIVSIELVTVHC